MVPDKKRRKSLSIFRPPVTELTPIHGVVPDSAPPAALKMKLRPASFFTNALSSKLSNSDLRRASSQGNAAVESAKPSLPAIRTRTLQRSARPTSLFGSYRSSHSMQDDEGLMRSASNPTSAQEDGAPSLDVGSMAVLYHGEVQTAGMFRKKSQYLVLTNTHIIRLKSRDRAAELFPTVSPPSERINPSRHSRISSSGSFAEQHIPADQHQNIPLQHVVATYKLDDGRPYFTIEIAHLDEATCQPSTMSLQLSDPRDADLWLTSIGTAVTNARLVESVAFNRKVVEYAVRAVEFEGDYDPKNFRMFKVVQRASKTGNRSSSDDLTKLLSNVCLLVIGVHKVHMVPLPKFTRPTSSTSLADQSTVSYGIASLSAVHVQTQIPDDSFQISFRIPLQQTTSLHLASSCVNDIVLCLRHSAEFLRPTWVEQPFVWKVPRSLDDAILPILPPEEEEDDHLCFDRTLTAYCVSYNVNPSHIRYAVSYTCEDAPEFELLEPAGPRRRHSYTALELLAVLRALRYNESFHAVTFRRIKLDALHGICDENGSEHLIWTTRSGEPLPLPRQDNSTLLVQEVQSLALKNKRLRRLDFSDCLTSMKDVGSVATEAGSGICAALFPLCILQLTNVDWIVLNGIPLAEPDLDYLYAAAIERSCHFRALDMGRCGLTDDALRIALQGMLKQEATLESVDISGNPTRIGPGFLRQHLEGFHLLRKLNLANLQLAAGPTALLPPEVLLNWRLEEMKLSGTSLNRESIESLAIYLASNQSATLAELHLDQCQLTGGDLACLMEALALGRMRRKMHIYAGENSLARQHHMLVETVSRSATPSHLTMRCLEYNKEEDFRSLIKALAANSSLEYLDISMTSLPLDAGEETCKRLKHMFETNRTLKELNISGERAHVEPVTLGAGLRDALQGLEDNTTLEILRIEHQALGLPGANALASILEKNSTLRELHCEDNEISLQAFTMLVDAMKHNKSLLYLPDMEKDRAWSSQKVDREVNSLRDNQPPSSAKATVKRAFGGTLIGGRTFSSRTPERSFSAVGYTEQDVKAAVASLGRTWDHEVARLHNYLTRNYCLANGLPVPDDVAKTAPGSWNGSASVHSLSTALKQAGLDHTPTAELDRQLSEKPADERPTEGATATGDVFELDEEIEGQTPEEDRDNTGDTLMMAQDVHG